MNDVIVIALIGAFFALCVAYVALCERIIGPDPEPVDAAESSTSVTDDGGPVAVEAVST